MSLASGGKGDAATLEAEIVRLSNGALTSTEAKAVFRTIVGPDNPYFSRDEGRSLDTAVRIIADSPLVGIAAEYEWLSAKFGRQNVDWSLDSQQTFKEGNIHYEVMTIRTADGQVHYIYFDITRFFGRF